MGPILGYSSILRDIIEPSVPLLAKNRRRISPDDYPLMSTAFEPASKSPFVEAIELGGEKLVQWPDRLVVYGSGQVEPGGYTTGNISARQKRVLTDALLYTDRWPDGTRRITALVEDGFVEVYHLVTLSGQPRLTCPVLTAADTGGGVSVSYMNARQLADGRSKLLPSSTYIQPITLTNKDCICCFSFSATAAFEVSGSTLKYTSSAGRIAQIPLDTT